MNIKARIKLVMHVLLSVMILYPLNSKAPFGVHKPWGTPPKRGHGKHYNAIKMVCPEVEELENLQEVIDV